MSEEFHNVQSFWADKYKNQAARNWDIFYKHNTTNFFKDRHWTDREFEELKPTGKKLTLLGCGVGNFVFPLLASNPDLFIYACDFSVRAVDMVKSNEQYDETRCLAFVADITKDDLSEKIPLNSLDLASAIFVLSAIPPEKMEQTFRNIYKVMKPGGILMFRDYGINDTAEQRFKTGEKNRMGPNFYIRRDLTFSYFFSPEYFEELVQSVGFEVLENGLVHREVTNRKKELTMDRIFLQSKIRRPVEDEVVQGSI